MCLELMPRVQELIARIEDRNNPDAYFQQFNETVRTRPLKRQTWLSRERELSRLDQTSWEFLKAEAHPYLISRDHLRGWSQLIAILNQARAHNFLLDEGCQNVRFIPRAKTKGLETPDLEAAAGPKKVLCEVKTIQISDDEAARRANGGLGASTTKLQDKFFGKLTSVLTKAKQQLCSFDSCHETRRIAFLLIDFDDSLGEYKQCYYHQIDDFLATDAVSNIEVVFYNQRTAFHDPAFLRHAIVINEN